MEDESLDIDHLLVIRLGALGDVANTLPAVSALRKRMPRTRFAWLVEEPSRELVAAARVADEVIVFPRRRLAEGLRRPWRWPAALGELWRFRKALRARAFACTLDLQGNLKSGFLGWLSGAPDRVGFAPGHCREWNWMFNTVLAAPAAKALPRAEKYAALAQVIEPELRLEAVSLPPNAAEAAAVDAFLTTLPGPGPLVLLHPGTSAFGEFKRWPAERYGALAAGLKARREALSVVTYGPAERALAEAVVAASGGAAVAAPALTLTGLIELIRRAELFVAADTGPLHIAALLRRPVVALFGPKDPVVYGPYGTRCEIVRADAPCSPCTRRTCDHGRCMTGVAVEQVLAAAERVLEAGRTP